MRSTDLKELITALHQAGQLAEEYDDAHVVVARVTHRGERLWVVDHADNMVDLETTDVLDEAMTGYIEVGKDGSVRMLARQMEDA